MVARHANLTATTFTADTPNTDCKDITSQKYSGGWFGL